MPKTSRKERSDRPHKSSQGFLESDPDQNPLWDYDGFLVRRVWQIHVAMFMEGTKGRGVTPVQFSILLVLRSWPGLDQVTLGAQIGVDRSTVTESLRRMQKSGLIERHRGTLDRRATVVFLTRVGETLLQQLDARVLKTHKRLVQD